MYYSKINQSIIKNTFFNSDFLNIFIILILTLIDDSFSGSVCKCRLLVDCFSNGVVCETIGWTPSQT